MSADQTVTGTNSQENGLTNSELTEKDLEAIFAEGFSKATGKTYPAPESSPPDPAPTEPAATPATPVEVSPVTAAVVTPPTDPVPAKVETTAPAKAEDVKPTTLEPKTSTVEELLQAAPESLRPVLKQLLNDKAILDHKARSNDGRVRALQNQVLERNRELADLRAKVASKQPQDLLAAASTADALKSEADWKALIDAEPQLAKAVDALVSAKVGNVEQRLGEQQAALDNKVKSLFEHNQQLDRQAEWNALVEQVPNVKEVMESEPFVFWRDNVAAPGLKFLAFNSIDHRDSINVLKTYTNDFPIVAQKMGLQMPDRVTEPAPQVTNQGSATAVTTTPSVADQIAQKRNDKVSPPVNQTRVTPAQTEADDDAYFAAAYIKNQRKR